MMASAESVDWRSVYQQIPPYRFVSDERSLLSQDCLSMTSVGATGSLAYTNAIDLSRRAVIELELNDGSCYVGVTQVRPADNFSDDDDHHWMWMPQGDMLLHKTVRYSDDYIWGEGAIGIVWTPETRSVDFWYNGTPARRDPWQGIELDSKLPPQLMFMVKTYSKDATVTINWPQKHEY